MWNVISLSYFVDQFSLVEFRFSKWLPCDMAKLYSNHSPLQYAENCIQVDNLVSEVISTKTAIIFKNERACKLWQQKFPFKILQALEKLKDYLISTYM